MKKGHLYLQETSRIKQHQHYLPHHLHLVKILITIILISLLLITIYEKNAYVQTKITEYQSKIPEYYQSKFNEYQSKFYDYQSELEASHQVYDNNLKIDENYIDIDYKIDEENEYDEYENEETIERRKNRDKHRINKDTQQWNDNEKVNDIYEERFEKIKDTEERNLLKKSENFDTYEAKANTGRIHYENIYDERGVNTKDKGIKEELIDDNEKNEDRAETRDNFGREYGNDHIEHNKIYGNTGDSNDVLEKVETEKKFENIAKNSTEKKSLILYTNSDEGTVQALANKNTDEISNEYKHTTINTENENIVKNESSHVNTGTDKSEDENNELFGTPSKNINQNVSIEKVNLELHNKDLVDNSTENLRAENVKNEKENNETEVQSGKYNSELFKYKITTNDGTLTPQAKFKSTKQKNDTNSMIANEFSKKRKFTNSEIDSNSNDRMVWQEAIGQIINLTKLQQNTASPNKTNDYENQIENTNLDETNEFKRKPTLYFPRARRRLPQALIIGVRKCGTRALLEMLYLHPRIQKAAGEVHFFDRDENYSKGLEWYRKQMPLSYPNQVTIEKSPSYFVTPEAPERIHAMNASVRILVIVRDPVTRAISDYTQLKIHAAATSAGPVRKFEQLALKDNGDINEHYRPIAVSMYHNFMYSWLEVFPKEQILIVNGDRLIEDPVPELQRIEQFLHLEPRINHDNFYFNHTKGFYCLKNNRSEKCLRESKGRKHVRVHPKVISKMRQYFNYHNQLFYDLVDEKFDWPEE